jgi:hypothetical protein
MGDIGLPVGVVTMPVFDSNRLQVMPPLLRIFSWLLALIVLTTSFAIHAVELLPGQVWKYKTRPGESSSTLTILKVESYKDLGRVVHIRVDAIRMTNPLKGNVVTDVPHLPFKEEAVQKSITELVHTSPDIPAFKEGYDVWKSAYIAGKAGAFDTTVNATLTAMLGGHWEVKE